MKRLEHNLQVQVVNVLRNYYHMLVFAVPNGGSRNAIEARNLKLEGALSGVSDLIVVTRDKVFFIELKVGKNKQQQSQIDFEQKIKELGHTYFVCRSVEEVLKCLNLRY